MKKSRIVAGGVFTGIVGMIPYINHLLWGFGVLMADSQSTGQIVLAILGAVIPLLGAAHGVYLWF